VSYWYLATSKRTGTIIVAADTNDDAILLVCHVYVPSDDKITLTVSLVGPPGSNSQVVSSNEMIPYDGNWHNIIIAWDMVLLGLPGPGTINYTLDWFAGTFDTIEAPYQTTFSVDYAVNGNCRWGVAGPESEYAGYLSELFCHIHNSSTHTNIRGGMDVRSPFAEGHYDKNTGAFLWSEPVDLGPDGSAPFGTTPAIYLHGDASTFRLNGGGSDNFLLTPASPPLQTAVRPVEPAIPARQREGKPVRRQYLSPQRWYAGRPPR
jgi:hypothetical protein